MALHVTPDKVSNKQKDRVCLPLTAAAYPFLDEISPLFNVVKTYFFQLNKIENFTDFGCKARLTAIVRSVHLFSTEEYDV